MKLLKSLYNKSRFLKRLSLISGLVFFYCLNGNAQIPNLLINGDFEDYSKCPTEQADFDNFVNEWTKIQGTPDYFNECGYTLNPLYNFSPKSGDGYAGIRTFSVLSQEGREFMMGSLKRGLNKGELILVINNFMQSDRNFLIDQHSILFSKNQIQVSDTLSTFYFTYNPQINWGLGLNRNISSYITYKDCFIAEGGEQYVTIGNFAEQDYVKVDSSIGSPNTIGAFTVYDDIKILSYNSIKPRDTVNCMLDSFYFEDKYDVGLLPFYQGDTLTNGFLPAQPGVYDIELHWGMDCGPIDTIQVTFTDCSSCSSPIAEVELCADKAQFNPSSYITADLIVSDTVIKACPGIYSYPVFHPHCTEAIDTLTITVKEYFECVPEIELDDQCRGTPVTLPNIGSLKYNFNPQVADEWQEEGMYSYKLIDMECQDTVLERKLEVLPCDDCATYIPNTFTPNRDGINDVFTMHTDCQITEFEAFIYDRWGGLIAESHQYDDIWDGKGYDNGVYVYSIRFRHKSSNGTSEQRMKGTITLIR